MKRTSLLLALVLSIASASGCRRHGADGINFEHHHDLAYEPLAEDAPSAEASRVEIHDSRSELPDAFYYDEYAGTPEKRFTVAPGYPSEERPHRVLGTIRLKERVDVSGYNEEKLTAAWKNEALRARREKLLAAEAARHGANALYLIFSSTDRFARMPERKRTYLAVYLSPDPPRYPDVETLLGRLELKKDGYHEVKRFTAKLEELPDRAPETIQLKRGHCYTLAIAFHPEPIDRPRGKVTSINFTYKVPNPEVFPGIPHNNAAAGGFSERRDGDKSMFRSLHHLDGIWSRTGAGEIACPVYRTQPAQLSFTTFDGTMLKNPPKFEPGRGTSEFVVYERKLSAEKFNEAACIRCYDVARQCSYREPLASCAELGKCLQTTGVGLGVCSDRYR
ncbi:hypothetical protein [Polyangium jinanense]|uniref:Lipoprotein n=1 Tax=Polyangium jinanense TaxID=2829994 RepID=A0A9X4AP11_9BACT|nr:hypothetical protein [Polyangium jinanense]MDC3953372.1 hypothetical protein [Polyangium jinanense]MDC3979508.1 hypothetical protein [Polyangium jinanense]